jgi:hypothetical protein
MEQEAFTDAHMAGCGIHVKVAEGLAYVRIAKERGSLSQPQLQTQTEQALSYHLMDTPQTVSEGALSLQALTEM